MDLRTFSDPALRPLVDRIGAQIDAYAAEYRNPGVVAEEPGDRGVPLEMQVGEVDADGWVDWRVLPSKLSESDLDALEREFGIALPRIVRAYFLARFHLLDQIHARSHDDQLVCLCDTPSDRPLGPLRESLQGWAPMHEHGLIAFGSWGDGWGPLSVDVTKLRDDGDAPVVWLEHELLWPETRACRATLEPLITPVFESFAAFLDDVFVSR